MTARFARRGCESRRPNPAGRRRTFSFLDSMPFSWRPAAYCTTLRSTRTCRRQSSSTPSSDAQTSPRSSTVKRCSGQMPVLSPHSTRPGPRAWRGRELSQRRSPQRDAFAGPTSDGNRQPSSNSRSCKLLLFEQNKCDYQCWSESMSERANSTSQIPVGGISPSAHGLHLSVQREVRSLAAPSRS